MRTSYHLRCEHCRSFIPTRNAILTPSLILCPLCATLVPPTSSPGSAPADATRDDDATGRSSLPHLSPHG